ncbi:RHS repeat-associated core domain-containing protein, partial [Pectobacterium parmentieri]
YDPSGGCYISPDPISIYGGVNNYSYVRNPIAYIDPFGLDELYALVASKDGWFDVMEWGKKNPVGQVYLR